jgi:hypothetical protein
MMRRGQAPAAIAIFTCAVIFVACSGSSPRFRTDEDKEAVRQDENEYRYSDKIREEVAREDDRKVDLTAARRRLEERRGTPDADYLAPPGVDRDKFLLSVVSFLGTPYSYGGSTKNGIDCSGFTSTVYLNALDLRLPRSAREQYRIGRAVDRSTLRFGDLVFFNTTGASPSHVGIYIEDDLFAHASVTAGVTISSLESTYYRKRWVGAKRVVTE